MILTTLIIFNSISFMNPIELLTNKLTSLNIPPKAMYSLDMASLITNISNPQDLKHNLFNQLIYNGELDINFAQGIMNDFESDDFLVQLSNLNAPPQPKPKGLFNFLFGK